MLLSIGLIVKNEEKYLEQCLTALQPILNSLDSELIIADTGSTDNTVEIAKKFTDNVFYFEWINDFAAARNSTLERATGEWYMFIDADEIFQSCDNIIKFFKSGEYQKYTLATYTIRNYSKLGDYSNYNDHYGLRLCKRVPGIRFKGAIHEIFDTSGINSVLKFIPDIADHFGYVFTSDTELQNKKMQRNLELLYKLVESGPFTDHPLAYKQIADCLSITNETEKALEYVNKGIDELNKADHDGFGIIDYYVKKFQLLYKLQRFSEIIDECKAFYQSKAIIKKGAFFSDIEIRFLFADSYKHLNMYNEAITQYAECLRMIRDEKRGKLDTPDKLLGNRLYTIDKNIINIVNDFALVCVLTNKFGTLDEHLKILPIEDHYGDHNYIDFRINLQFEIMDHLGYKDLQKWYLKLDDYGKKAFNQFSRHGFFFTQKQEERIDAILKLKTDDTALLDIFKVYKVYFCDNITDISAIYEFAEKYGYNDYPELLYIMLYINADIAPFVRNDFFNEKTAKDIIGNYPDFAEIFCIYDTSKISADGLPGAALLAKVLIFNALDQKKSIEKLLIKFGSIGKAAEDADNNSAEINAAKLIYNITAARRSKDYKLCINEMRKLIQLYPEYAPIVKEYQALIKNEILPKRNERSELAEMSAAVKKNVREMIAAKSFAAAEKTLNKLAQIVPGDPEIDMLREQIENAR